MVQQTFEYIFWAAPRSYYRSSWTRHDSIHKGCRFVRCWLRSGWLHRMPVQSSTFYFKEILPAASISTLTFFFAMTVTVSPNVSVVVKHVGALENSTLSLPSLDGEASAVFSRAPTTIPPFWPRPLQ